jgi:hypothetical protein
MGLSPRERLSKSLAVESAQWFALPVNTRYQQAVAASLEGENLECLGPVLQERRRWSDRITTVQSPILPGRLFCRLGRTAR